MTTPAPMEGAEFRRERPDCVMGRSLHRFPAYEAGVCRYCGTERKRTSGGSGMSFHYRPGEWSGLSNIAIGNLKKAMWSDVDAG